MSSSSTNQLAAYFKSLHKPGNPVVLANVYDPLSARTVGKLKNALALATASYGVAQANGLEDDELDLETNLEAVKHIVPVAAELKKPLSVDLQDGYGDRLEEAITRLIELGVVGINIEDYDRKRLMPVDVAVDRIRRVLAVAKEKGVPDFVVNARCDVLVQGGKLEEVISRGKQYLAAGATTVFVWGASRGVHDDEVSKLVEAFEGRLNVSMRLAEGYLKVADIKKLGAARISIGPGLQFVAMAALAKRAEEILEDVSSV
jgi:2-methylisocitrate lyase-like PEP mutase family enzyme